jgi:hypothetical protein
VGDRTCIVIPHTHCTRQDILVRTFFAVVIYFNQENWHVILDFQIIIRVQREAGWSGGSVSEGVKCGAYIRVNYSVTYCFESDPILRSIT